jgi:hypothetical protein
MQVQDAGIGYRDRILQEDAVGYNIGKVIGTGS